jgi:very-short-patch-repair endonuclease
MRHISAARDLRLAELAARQHGVVAHRQLLRLGFSASGIQRLLQSGRLHRVHHGVYAVGHPLLTARGRVMAAVRACGDGAFASHITAAWLLDLLDGSGAKVHVSAESSGTRHRRGVVFHRVRRLHPDDRAVEEGIPVTSVARTLLDLAEVVRPDRLERAFEAAERLGRLDMRKLDELMGRSHGRRGLAPLRELIAASTAPEPTRSELERRFFSLMRRAGLPLPSSNVVVAGYEVDAFWRKHHLIVELDSRRHHATRRAFEADRAKDAELQLAGYRVIRITWKMVTREPAAVVATMRAFLG